MLNDPRTGLMIYVESDGRHASALTRKGTILWHKDLFGEPLPGLYVPPPVLSGEHPQTVSEDRRAEQAIRAKLVIGGIAVVSDCTARAIDDGHYPRAFPGHYIAVGAGHYGFLLDAKTGDFLLEAVN